MDTDVPRLGHNSVGVGQYLVDHSLTYWAGIQAPKKARKHDDWDEVKYRAKKMGRKLL